jgi:glc operon protein GlcG
MLATPRRAAFGAAALLLTLAAAAPAATQSGPLSITREEAARALALAVAEARRLGAPGGAVAVVDAGGHPVALERLDGTFPAAGTISIGKARTAALFQRPSRVLEEAINKGRTAMGTLSDAVGAVPLQGGVPLTRGGSVIGAVGVSGAASAAQDEEIAAGAAQAFGAAPAVPAAGHGGLVHLGSADVRDAFAVGRPLAENGAFKVHASRRDAPGEAEVHAADTDIFYVLSGEGTMVLGGELDGARRETGSNELRAAGIASGEEHPLAAGDVLVIPAGTPHWFREVRSPMTYYVVKVTEGSR